MTLFNDEPTNVISTDVLVDDDLQQDAERSQDMDLVDLYQKLASQETEKLDMVARPEFLTSENAHLIVNMPGGTTLDLTPTNYAYGQVLDKMGIPRKYGRLLADGHPELFDSNVNYWLRNEREKEKGNREFMLRSFTGDKRKGTLRAMLGSSYFDIGNVAIMDTLLQLFADISAKSAFTLVPDIQTLTDRSIYVRFVAPELEQTSHVLDHFRHSDGNQDARFFSGVIFRNSEVGAGAFEMAPTLITGACINRLVFKDHSFMRAHLGSKMTTGIIKFSAETQRKELELIQAQVKDLFKVWMSPEFLGQTVSQVEQLASRKLEHSSAVVVRIANDVFGLSQERTMQAIEYLNRCGHHDNAFGVVQAFTDVSKGLNGDERYALESKVHKLPFELYDKPANDKVLAVLN